MSNVWLWGASASELTDALEAGETTSVAIVSALAWPFRRSNSRTSMRVERPAIMVGSSGRLAAMLAQPGTIYYIRILTKDLGVVKLASEREK